MSSSLGQALASETPKGVRLSIHHIATNPTPCDAIFAAAPGKDAEPTTRENHFLTVSADLEANEELNGELFVFAIEVLVYSTAELTTVFVSKADSTGYAYRLKLPPTGSSVIRTLSSAFLSHIIRTHQRPATRLVLSLFARAQNQYIFPGSVENSHKHILDDRGLVKWWCRVVDPILRSNEPETHGRDSSLVEGSKAEGQQGEAETETQGTSATAYLIVPGCDRFETKAFFPPTAKSDLPAQPRWLNSYPLHQICTLPTAPPRCLVPRFPDDPKARFLVDLDDEIPEDADSSLENKLAGQWRSVRTLDQFWELMAFRQECSAGRLVGFLWMVVNPPGLVKSAPLVHDSSSAPNEPANSTTENSKSTEENQTPTVSSVAKKDDSATILDNAGYQALMDHILQLDFADEKIAVESTNSWISKLRNITGKETTREIVMGEREPVTGAAAQMPTTEPIATATMATTTTNLLSSGLIKKRKKATVDDADENVDTSAAANGVPVSGPSSSAEQTVGSASTPAVNTLSAGLIKRKKKKT